MLKEGINNCDVISDEKIKSIALKKSIFAVAKSGTVSLEIVNSQVPSIIIYKMNSINFLILKSLVKVKFANIINIASEKEIIPELLQSNCNPNDIFKKVDYLLNNDRALQDQLDGSQKIINDFKTNKSSEIASKVLINYL